MAAVEFNRYDKALIADIIHDRFVDLESVDWDKAGNILEIPYFNESDLKTPEGKIRVHNVLAVNITDAEKVRYYDLNFIKWDEKNNIISLFTGIPLVFEIWMTNFKIMIVRPDECGPEFSATRPADSILAPGRDRPAAEKHLSHQ